MLSNTMKTITIYYEDKEFEDMNKAKSKLGITWKEVIARGLKGGKDGKK